MKFTSILLISFLFANTILAQQNTKECEIIYAKAISLFDEGNYQLAIKKIAAYKLCCSPKDVKKADTLLIKIFETVNQQKNDAIEAKKAAELSEKKAKKQEKIATSERDKAQGNYLISEAKSVVDSDPTLALRLAEEAMKKSKDSAIFSFANKIYRENTFYSFPYGNTHFNSAKFSPNGEMLFLGLLSNNAAIVNLTNKKYQIIKRANYFEKATFSFDNKYILTFQEDYSSDHKAQIITCWDLNGNIINEYDIKEVTDIQFSPNNYNFIISYRNENVFRLLDLDGNTLQTFQGHTGNVNAVAFSSDGKYIVSGSSDQTSRLWNLDGECLNEYKRHQASIISIAFSPNGKLILTGSRDKTAKLMSTEGELISEIKDHNDAVRTVSFSHDGNLILTGSQNEKIILSDLNGNNIQEFKGHADYIDFAGFFPDDKNILTISRDQTARKWEIKKITNSQYEDSEFYDSSIISNDDKYILKKTIDGTAQLTDINGKNLRKFLLNNCKIESIDLSPDNSSIVTGTNAGSVILWDKDGKITNKYTEENVKYSFVKFSPDGSNIAIGQQFRDTISVWNIRTNLVKKYPGTSNAIFSPDGSHLICINYNSFEDQNVFIYNLEDDSVEKYEYPLNFLYKIIHSPKEEKILAFSERSNKILLLTLKGKLIRTLSYKSYLFDHASFSADGKKILVIGNDEIYDKYYLLVFDLNGYVLQELYLGENEPISPAKFSSDGNLIFIDADNKNEPGLQLIKWQIPITLSDFLKTDKIAPLSPEQKQKYNIK